MKLLREYGHVVPALYAAFIFIQSLFFKFRNSPETRWIFETRLHTWAAGFGQPGLFAPGGIFSAKVVGSVELVASLLILAGTFLAPHRVLQGLGALVGLVVISGALFFHLSGAIGIPVIGDDGKSDSGTLFVLACGVFVACLLLIYLRRGELLSLVS